MTFKSRLTPDCKFKKELKAKLLRKISKEIPDDNQIHNSITETGNELYLESKIHC